MEVSGQPHAPATSPLGKETMVLLQKRLGGAQGWYRRSGKEKNPCTSWEFNPGLPAYSWSLN
jgi:hypothetical protein